MDRRNFFNILTATSAGVLSSCSKTTTDALIPMLVPEHEIVPGEEQWHPAVCTECAAGCGTIVRVMEGVRTVERNGETVRERVAAIKKIEGNPLDPVSGGRLCARGQAAVQSLYHPDRVRNAMKRTGERGKAQFAGIAWDAAMAEAAEKIAKADPSRVLFLTGPVVGTRSLAAERFTAAIGAPAPIVCSPADLAAERKAAELVFGWKGLPVYDIANARHVLSVGADFLGAWASPVYYSRQYGHFRQGRPGVRGHLVHAESRMSLTAGAADRWLPLRPGTEVLFLAAVGRMLDVGGPFERVDASSLLSACGLEERRVREAVEMLRLSDAPLVISGGSHDAAVASHLINLKLGNVDEAGGVGPPILEHPVGQRNLREALANAQVVLIEGTNPAYTLSPKSGVLDALKRADTLISFASFVDDSAAWSDLVLPSHHPLESEIAVRPMASSRPTMNVGTPFVRPLYDTRPLEKVLGDLAKGPAVTVKDMLPSDVDVAEVARQGGWWVELYPGPAAKVATVPLTVAAATFDGDPSQFPLFFQPYFGVQYGDGSGANLPWLQELPDATSSSIWGLPVEIDPKTAAALDVANGDVVRVESPHGSLEAPAYVHPGAVPGVVSMAAGDGHSFYTRYASGRGANPFSILGSEGGRTRVKLSRIGGRSQWIQFAAPDREEKEHSHR